MNTRPLVLRAMVPAVLTALVAAACASGGGAGWTYAPIPSTAAPAASPAASDGGSGAPGGSDAPSQGPILSSPGSSPGAPPPSAEGSGDASGAPESAAPSAGESPSASGGEGQVTLGAEAVEFDTDQLTIPADQPFQLVFDNRDTGVQHNVSIYESIGGPNLFQGELFPGPESRTYEVPAIPAGEWVFVCDVHPNMTGTVTSQ